MESIARTISNAPATAPATALATPLATAVALALLLGGCATQDPSPDATGGDETAAPAPQANDTAAGADGTTMVATTFGKGTYSDSDGAVVSFMYDAELDGAGRSKGFFRHQGTYGDGTIDLSGEVTCVSFDHPGGRAWIAGTISANRSTTDFASEAQLPVGSVAGFVVVDASVAPEALIGFPAALSGKPDKAANKHCSRKKWPSSGLHSVSAGTLGVFP